jgi:hypothetical protein
MPRWDRDVYHLRDGHTWKAKPGYKIFVADRGAVRFDFPESWIVEPTDDSIKFTDRPEPDDTCVLQVSVMHLRRDVDWTSLSLATLLTQVTGHSEQEVLSRGPVHELRRGDLEIAWMETRFVDPGERREARTYYCFARRVAIQPLITLTFWPEDAARLDPMWQEVLRSLRVGDVVADPRRASRN